jgi:glutamine cyclotransferase
LWANVYLTDKIVVIDPATGQVEGVLDFAGLLSESEMDSKTDVLNGIAYDEATGRIFITGKNWPKLFEIEVIK